MQLKTRAKQAKINRAMLGHAETRVRVAEWPELELAKIF